MHPTALIITSSLIIIFSLLTLPILTTLNPNPRGPDWAISHVKTAVKLAFLVSLLPLFLFINDGAEAIVTS